MSDPSGRIALDITASANVAEVAKARSEVSALGDAAKKSADLTRQAWQEAGGDLTKMGQIYQRLTMSVEQTTTAVAEQTVVVREAETTWTGFAGGGSRRMQSAFVSMAFAGEAFTRSMDAGDGALRRVFRSLSMLGFLGGPELGVATTAIASMADSMIDMWTRSEKAAKKAQDQFQRTLETMARGTLASAAETRQSLYSGDPFAALTGQREGESALQFLGRSGGQRALEQEQARLRSLVAEQDRLTNKGTTATTAQALERKSYIDQLKEVNQLLATQDQRLAAVDGVYGSLLAKQQELARFELQRLRDRADARRTFVPEVPIGIGDLGAQEAAFGIQDRNRFGNLGVRGFGVPTGLLAQRSVDTSDKAGGSAFRIQPAEIIQTQFHLMQVEAAKSSEEFQKYLSTRVGSTMADGLVAGIRAGFSGSSIKGAFAAGSKAILAGLGGMLIDEGRVYLEKAAIMQSLVPFLFSPPTAGWAAAGIGTALVALGAGLEGLASRGSGGGGGGGAAANGNTFTPSNVASGGGVTLIVQTVNPFSREVVSATTYYINRSGMLNAPVIPPPGAPS